MAEKIGYEKRCEAADDHLRAHYQEFKLIRHVAHHRATDDYTQQNDQHGYDADDEAVKSHTPS